MKELRNLATGDLLKLGTLYLGGIKKTRPTNPINGGDVPAFSAGQTIEIRDTDASDAYKLQWREINDGGKKYLVADRAIIQSISWDDLNGQSLIFGKTITIDGQQYKLRSLTGGSNYRGSDGYSGGSPTSNEWDRWIVNEAGLAGLPTPNSTELTNDSTNQSGAHNQFWNWYNMYSWAQETYTGNGSYRALRGIYSARYWGYNTSSIRATSVGFRPVLEVLNAVPVVSGTDENLGEQSSSFTRDYTIDDSDASDTLTIVEKIDDTNLRTIENAVRNQTYSLDLSSAWSELSLGDHTITITVSDGNGASAVRTFTFTKVDDRIIFSGKGPIETSLSAKEVVVSGVIKLAENATLKIEACNNAFDDLPAWEDVTNAFINKEAHEFTNATKTAERWGINYRVTLLKNDSIEKSYVEAIGINFGRG